MRRRVLTGLMRVVAVVAVAVAGVQVPPVGAPASAHAAMVPLRPGQTGRVVVGFEPGAAASATSAVTRAGGRTKRRSDPGRFLVVQPKAGESPDEFAERVAKRPGVRYAEPERTMHAVGGPDSYDFHQWNLDQVGAKGAWAINDGDPSVTVAVVDSGVDLTHPDLLGRLDTVNDYDFVQRDSAADDKNGHGTHVTGIIAASDNDRYVTGLAHECRVLPVKVLNDMGRGDDSVVAEGIRYAAARGADVINLSLAMNDGTSQVLEDAVEYALSKDVVVVAAAGNDGGVEAYRGLLAYPAAFPDVIAVGATDINEARWSDSQFGDQLDLMAPGVDILSLKLDGSTSRLTGTSMASAHVAAAAALVRAQYPSWSAARVATRLEETAQDLGAPGRDDDTGHGMVRADAALSPAGAPSDDTLPGLRVTTSPVAGTVGASDPRDIYAVSLREGQRLRVSFTASVGTTASVALYGSDVTTLTGAVPAAAVTSTGSRKYFELEVPAGTAGIHSLAVTAPGGTSRYSLSWLRGYQTSVSLMAPTTCAWGGRAYVQGRVLRGGAAMTAMPVTLDAKPVGASNWTLGVAKTTTGSYGVYTFTVRPSRRMSYRVRFTGAPGELSSYSRTADVSPKAYLSMSLPGSAIPPMTRFTVSGALRPEHALVPSAVALEVWMWDAYANGWVRYRTLTTVSQDRIGYTRYVRAMALPRGRWRIRATVPQDYWHAATQLTADLTVR